MPLVSLPTAVVLLTAVIPLTAVVVLLFDGVVGVAAVLPLFIRAK